MDGLATPTGFEPAISALTGQCVRPLHHGAAKKLAGRAPEAGMGATLNLAPAGGWWAVLDLNQ